MFKLASLVANELKRQKKPHFKFIAPVYILASSQLQLFKTALLRICDVKLAVLC